jgi:hypothetical protein
MKPSDAQQLQELAEQLRLLIECADRLPPSAERDAAFGEIVQYRDRLDAITARKAEQWRCQRRRYSRPMGGTGSYINFGAPAVLRKWPSLRNERRTEGTGPYLLIDGTLDECMREFMVKSITTRHLYEILTAPQPPVVSAILSGEHIVELARLRDFLWSDSTGRFQKIGDGPRQM